MKEVSGYNPSKDPRLINCKTECGNERCFGKRYGLFAEKTCPNFKEPKPLTNADRIRAMTGEELAEFMAQTGTEYSCPPPHYFGETGFCRNEDVDMSCRMCWLDWLKRGVDYGQAP